MLGGTLRRLGIGAGSEQNNFLVQLVMMDEPFEGFFQFISKRVIEEVGEEEAAKLAGSLLKKQYDEQSKLEIVFHPKSFNYHLTLAILERTSFSATQHAPEVYKILDELMASKASESPRSRKPTTAEKVSDLYDKVPDESDKKFEQKLRGLFRTIPPTVITLLLPLYHSFVEKTGKNAKNMFAAAFYTHFFQAPMLDFQTPDQKPPQRKRSLLVNAELTNPFFNLLEALETANNRFAAVSLHANTITTLKSIVDKFTPLFRFKQKTEIFTSIFGRFYDCIKRDAQTEQLTIYRQAAENPKQYALSLMERAVEAKGEVSQMLQIGEELFQNVLKSLTEDTLTSLEPLIALDKRLTPIRERINEVAQVLSQAAALYQVDSPASNVYSNGASDLRALFEELSKIMLDKLVSWNEGVIEETILHYQTRITACTLPLMREPVDEQTILHRMVSFQPTDKKQYQKDLECLLREGADPDATTTKYEKKGSSLKGFVAKLIPGKNPPISTKKLAEQYENGAVLTAAIQNVEDARAKQENDKNEQFRAFLSHSAGSSRRNSQAEPDSEAEVLLTSVPVLPILSDAEMKRIDKRNRSPGSTPRGSEEGQAEKKKRFEPAEVPADSRVVRPKIGTRGSET